MVAERDGRLCKYYQPGERLAEAPLGKGEDVTAAIEAADAAFPDRRRTPPEGYRQLN